MADRKFKFRGSYFEAVSMPVGFVVIDNNGDGALNLPAGDYSDEILIVVLGIKAAAYGEGLTAGMDKKAAEIREALGIFEKGGV